MADAVTDRAIWQKEWYAALGRKGGAARALKLSPTERRNIAKLGAKAAAKSKRRKAREAKAC